MRELYFDAGATLKPDKRVVQSMLSVDKNYWYNPSSKYAPSEYARVKIEKARRKISSYIHCKPDEIIFTSSASESNSTVLNTFKNNNIITSTLDHHDVQAYTDSLREENVDYFKIDSFGQVDLKNLKKTIECVRSKRNDKILVTCPYVQSEIGTIQDVKKISDTVHEFGNVYLLVDATQAIGKFPIDFRKLGIDYMTMSGHKIGTPRGIGMLVKKHGVPLKPLIYGAQENGLRGGTYNTAGIVGLAKAFEIVYRGFRKPDFEKDIKSKFNYFMSQLSLSGIDGCINGAIEHRDFHNINITLDKKYGFTADDLIFCLSNEGIYISSGSACNCENEGDEERKMLFASLGKNTYDVRRTIRITLPNEVTNDDIDYFVEKLNEIIGRGIFK